MSSEPVGSLAEEAARLLAVVQSWAQDQRPRPDSADADDPASDAGDHADHDPLAAECRYCPLCAVARLAKAATPEVREHLAVAASSLAFAARALVDNATRPPEPDPPVEKIDLAED